MGVFAQSVCALRGHMLEETEAAQWSHAEVGTPVRCSRCRQEGRLFFERGREWISWRGGRNFEARGKSKLRIFGRGS